MFWPAESGKPLVLCAQGVSPAAATIESFRSRGHVLVPGIGVEAACVPGSFGGWLLLLEQFGTWTLDDVLAYAIGYAEHGYPVVDGITATIARAEPLLRQWPGRPSSTCLLRSPAPRSATRNSPRPGGACSPSPAGRSTARGASTTRASSPTRSTASRPSKEGSSRVRTWRPGARRSSRPRPSTTAGSRCARRPRGGKARRGCSSCACSKASTSRPSARRSWCTSSPRRRSWPLPTGTRTTAM